MATVINNPAPAQAPPSEGNNGIGFLLGVIVLIIFAILFFIYGLPYISSSLRGPQVNIPGKVDVNIHNSK